MNLSLLALDATRVVVIRGSGFDAGKRSKNSVLHTERDPQAMVALAGLLVHENIVQGGDAWMELPELSLVFLRERVVLLELGLLADCRIVRTPESLDVTLRDAAWLEGWLAANVAI